MSRQVQDTYVQQIMKYGNITNTARALGISQPALSQSLNNLEHSLGFKIFNRRTNPISLTPEGKIYYEYICRQEVLEHDFEKRLEAFRGVADQRVTIATPLVYINSILAPAVSQLLSCHPEYDIKVLTCSVDEAIEMASEGKIDCFISTREELPENFASKAIYREEAVLCVAEDSPLNERFRDGIDPAALTEERFIFLNDALPLQKMVNHYLAEKDVQVKRKMVVDQVAAAVDLTENGIGICFASREACKGRRVSVYPLGLMGRSIAIAFDQEQFQTQACRELIEIMEQLKTIPL